MDRLDADALWLIAAAALVTLLPLGQVAIGAAQGRPSHARGVAPRAAADLVAALLVTWLFGFSWVHGPSLAGVLGLAPGPVALEGADVGWRSALATWHGLAVGAAVVIAGSGGTGRARPLASLLLGLVVSALVLPLAAHWAWGGRPDGVPLGWLGRLGFLDHGGAVVVHVTAGAAGLALASAIGPRRGRFDAMGQPVDQRSRAPTLEVLGTGLTVAGGLGLVAAGRAGWRVEVPGALLCSLVGAAAGVAGAAAVDLVLGRPTRLRAGRLGAVAGMVSTAGGALLGGPVWALVTGFLGGALALVVDRMLLRAGIDDPVGVGSAHLAAGLWAALAAAFVVEAPGLPLRIAVQGIGAVAVAALAGGVAHGVLVLVDQLLPLRISPFSEDFGSAPYAPVAAPWDVGLGRTADPDGRP